MGMHIYAQLGVVWSPLRPFAATLKSAKSTAGETNWGKSFVDLTFEDRWGGKGGLVRGKGWWLPYESLLGWTPPPLNSASRKAMHMVIIFCMLSG